jgi:hypothetical protein
MKDEAGAENTEDGDSDAFSLPSSFILHPSSFPQRFFERQPLAAVYGFRLR